MKQILIRDETAADLACIFRINKLAFGRADEGALVDTLRDAGAAQISLVAESEGKIRGHILFSPVTIIPTKRNVAAVALGPLAVAPAHQRLGIGSQLVEAGLERCRDEGYDLVFVLGHAEYYPRFGFRPAARYDLASAFEVPPAFFMVWSTRPDTLIRSKGTVHYHPQFDKM